MVDRLVNSEANARRIALVESCFGASGQPLFVPGRVLVGEGVLTKMCRKKPKPRQVFLFNDILVYGNIIMSKKKYNQQHIIPLEEVQLSSLEDNGQYRNGWLIKTPTKSFAVYAATATEKSEWMAHINKCVQDLLRKSGKKAADTHAAVWVPDDAAATCQHCQKVQFNVIQRRHHCRKCGRVVCGACSSKKILLPHQSTKPLRCCLACYDEVSAAVHTQQNQPSDGAVEPHLLDSYLDPLDEMMTENSLMELEDSSDDDNYDIFQSAPLYGKDESSVTDGEKEGPVKKQVSFSDDLKSEMRVDNETAEENSNKYAVPATRPIVPKRLKKLSKMVKKNLSSITEKSKKEVDAEPSPSETVASITASLDQSSLAHPGAPVASEPAEYPTEAEITQYIQGAGDSSSSSDDDSDELADVNAQASLIENYYLTSNFVSYARMNTDSATGIEDYVAEGNLTDEFHAEINDDIEAKSWHNPSTVGSSENKFEHGVDNFDFHDISNCLMFSFQDI